MPQAFMSGYREADKESDLESSRRLDSELSDAKAQFEAALQSEMQGKVASSAGDLLDGLAKQHVKTAAVMTFKSNGRPEW